MVVTLLYTCTGMEIGTKIGIEIWRYGEKQYIPMPICLGCLEFVGSDFLTSIKNFFNFPNFFHNYLIFNAFQI